MNVSQTQMRYHPNRLRCVIIKRQKVTNNGKEAENRGLILLMEM